MDQEPEESPQKGVENKKGDNNIPKEEARQRKKMTGVGFYMVLTMLLINDAFDILAGLSVIFFIFTIFTGIVAQGVEVLYLYWNGVKLNDRKLATILVSSIIKVIPFINMIPTGALSLWMIRKIENSPAARKIAEHNPA